MMLSFKNNADFTFHSIGISTRDISGGILNADGSPIEKGQILRKEYIDQTDIDLEGEAAFNIALIDKEENRIPLKTKILKLEENKEYFFEITGSSESDAALKRIDKAGG
ncbi:hypothetical protein [Salibacterium qingdaonense]|nr:hypothetical protein [Salibacterium qingdaonense]